MPAPRLAMIHASRSRAAPLPLPLPPAPTSEAVAAEPGAPPPQATWRDLAVEGRFDQAYARLSAVPEEALAADPGGLLLAADVFRLTAHPRAALAPLRRVLEGHAADPRAPLAAFTLGRVLLDDLGEPREAAGAFRAAGDLDPDGSLAEDALAREVEAWSRVGEPSLARDRAQQYVRSFPEGRRLRLVKRFGGLE
jgi:transmembrane sensor